MQKFILLSSAAFIAAIAPALAGAAAPEMVVVSATRSQQAAEKTGESITVLSGDDLTEHQSVLVTDALEQTPGLTVNRTGGIGQVATVSLRGAEAGQTVALIDGIRINDPSNVTGSALFGDVPVDNIARIEILRGPQSTLYGSDAIGGVVNIITKRGGDSPFALNLSAEGGSWGTWRLNAAANGTAGLVDYGAAINAFGTKGISAADTRGGNFEADGYRNFSATLNTRIHAGNTISLDLRGYYNRAHADFDDSYDYSPPYALKDSNANNSNSLYAGYLGANGDFFGGRFHNRLALIATTAERDFFDSAYDTVHLNYDYGGSAVRFEYQGVVDIDAGNQLVFGAETEASAFHDQNFYSYMASEYIAGHKRITGGYAQFQSTLFENFTLTGGVRYDEDEKFGGHTSLKLAAAWQVPGLDTTLRANYGDGFKAPTLYQLFSPYSNPVATLKPETAKGWEIGADKNFWNGRLKASLTYFERRTSNQIDFQTCYSASDAPGCPQRLAEYGYYINIDRSRVTGVEAALEARLDDTLKLSANYTNMSAIDLATGRDLARRPHDSANASVSWQPLEDLTLGASLNYTGKRFNDAGNGTPLSSNTTVDLFAAVDLSDQWQAFGRIDNLFDDRTQRVTGYGSIGIAATIGVRTHL